VERSFKKLKLDGLNVAVNFKKVMRIERGLSFDTIVVPLSENSILNKCCQPCNSLFVTFTPLATLYSMAGAKLSPFYVILHPSTKLRSNVQYIYNYISDFHYVHLIVFSTVMASELVNNKT